MKIGSVMTVLDVFEKNMPAIMALTGVTIGHIATISLPFLQRRREKTEAINRLSYWLLEMWWSTDETYFVEYRKEIKKLLVEIGIEISDAQIKDLINASAGPFFEKIEQKNRDAMKKANQGIETHLPALMNHYPLLAFKISDYSQPVEESADFKQRIDDFINDSLSADGAKAPPEVSKAILDMFDEAVSENELSEAIKDAVLKLSFANGIRRYMEMKLYLYKQKKKRIKNARKIASVVRGIMLKTS